MVMVVVVGVGVGVVVVVVFAFRAAYQDVRFAFCVLVVLSPDPSDSFPRASLGDGG